MDEGLVSMRAGAPVAPSGGLLDALLDLADDTYVVLDDDRRVRVVNAAARELWGWPLELVVGVEFADLVVVDDSLALSALLDAADTAPSDPGEAAGAGTVEHGRARAVAELRIRRQDGLVRRVEVAALRLPSPSPDAAMVVKLRDLADRERATEVGERAERRLQKVLSSLPSAVGMVDVDGRLWMVSSEAGGILGFPAGSWDGSNVFEYVHPDDADRAGALHRAVLADPGRVHTEQLRVRRGDGGWAHLEVTVVNMVGDPDVGALVLSSRNISNQVEMERALRASYRKAVDSLAAKATFVAQLSHEIRTPIHGIVGLSELLAEGSHDVDAQRLVSAITRSAESLTVVVDDLLDHVKAEVGRLELSEHPYSPHRLVAEVVDMLRPAAEHKGLTLAGSLDVGVPAFLFGDGLRVRQVLVNLLGNAVKYTDAGSVHLEVHTRHRSGSVCELEMAVSDTGVGIPAEEFDQLFDPFTQASTTVRMGEPGTGLGLAITRQLVELMGGRISVTSEVGSGSTFRLLLPGRVATADQAARVTRELAALPQLGARVLVVEDSPVTQALIERQLRQLGCDPLVVSSPTEASALLGELDFDVVLVDRNLDGSDGLDVVRTQRQRQHQRLRSTEARIPMVVMTADATSETRAVADEAGADLVLVKPVGLAAMATELAGLLFGDHAPWRDASDLSDRVGERRPWRRSSVHRRQPYLVNQRVLTTLVDEVGGAVTGAKVLRTYLDELGPRLAVLGKSEQANDGSLWREVLQRTAHTLKSTSRALGADLLADACGVLETVARDPAQDPTDQAAAVRELAERTATEFRSCLEQMEGPDAQSVAEEPGSSIR